MKKENFFLSPRPLSHEKENRKRRWGDPSRLNIEGISMTSVKARKPIIHLHPFFSLLRSILFFLLSSQKILEIKIHSHCEAKNV